MRLGSIAAFFCAAMAFSLAVPSAAVAQYRDLSFELPDVDDVSPPLFLGRWYEIARYPNRFEHHCFTPEFFVASREDTSSDSGNILATYICHRNSATGKKGVNTVLANLNNEGSLRVRFIPSLPFLSIEFKIIYVDDAYKVVALGDEKGKYGWIIAREPTPDYALVDVALNALKESGYRLSDLVWVNHGQAVVNYSPSR